MQFYSFVCDRLTHPEIKISLSAEVGAYQLPQNHKVACRRGHVTCLTGKLGFEFQDLN